MNRMITTSLLLLTLFLAAPVFAQLYPPPESIEHPEALEPSVLSGKGPLKKRIEAAKIVSIDIVGEGIEIESQYDTSYIIKTLHTKVIPLVKMGEEFIMYYQSERGGSTVPQELIHLQRVEAGYELLEIIAIGLSCSYGQLSLEEVSWDGQEFRFFMYYSLGGLFREIGNMEAPPDLLDHKLDCRYKAFFIYRPDTREVRFESIVLEESIVGKEAIFGKDSTMYLSEVIDLSDIMEKVSPTGNTHLKKNELVQFLKALKAELSRNKAKHK